MLAERSEVPGGGTSESEIPSKEAAAADEPAHQTRFCAGVAHPPTRPPKTANKPTFAVFPNMAIPLKSHYQPNVHMGVGTLILGKQSPLQEVLKECNRREKLYDKLAGAVPAVRFAPEFGVGSGQTKDADAAGYLVAPRDTKDVYLLIERPSTEEATCCKLKNVADTLQHCTAGGGDHLGCEDFPFDMAMCDHKAKLRYDVAVVNASEGSGWDVVLSGKFALVTDCMLRIDQDELRAFCDYYASLDDTTEDAQPQESQEASETEEEEEEEAEQETEEEEEEEEGEEGAEMTSQAPSQEGGDDAIEVQGTPAEWVPEADAVQVFTMIRGRFKVVEELHRARALAKGEPTGARMKIRKVEAASWKRYGNSTFGIYGVGGLWRDSDDPKGFYVKGGNPPITHTEAMVMPFDTFPEYETDASSAWEKRAGKTRPTNPLRLALEAHFAPDGRWLQAGVRSWFKIFPDKGDRTWLEMAEHDCDGFLDDEDLEYWFPEDPMDDDDGDDGDDDDGNEKKRKHDDSDGDDGDDGDDAPKPKPKPKPKKANKPRAKKDDSESEEEEDYEVDDTDDDDDDDDADDGAGPSAASSSKPKRTRTVKQRKAAKKCGKAAKKIADRENKIDVRAKKKEQQARRKLEGPRQRPQTDECLSAYELQREKNMLENDEKLLADCGSNPDLAVQARRLQQQIAMRKKKIKEAEKQIAAEAKKEFAGSGPVVYMQSEEKHFHDGDLSIDKMTDAEKIAFVDVQTRFYSVYPAGQKDSDSDDDDDDDEWEDAVPAPWLVNRTAEGTSASPVPPDDLVVVDGMDAPAQPARPAADAQSESPFLSDDEAANYLKQCREKFDEFRKKQEDSRAAYWAERLADAQNRAAVRRADARERKRARLNKQGKKTYSRASWRGSKRFPSCGSPAGYVGKYGCKGMLVAERECTSQMEKAWDVIQATKRVPTKGARVPCPTDKWHTKLDGENNRPFKFVAEDGLGHGTVAMTGPSNYPHATDQWIGIAQNNWITTYFWLAKKEGADSFVGKYITRKDFAYWTKVREAEEEKASEAEQQKFNNSGYKGLRI